MSSFWLILKQQWTIEEISIFSNSSHLEWRAGLSDTILKGTHPRTIPARFGLIRFRGFRGEDLNVKVYDVRRMPRDGKSSHGTWPGELKTLQRQELHCNNTMASNTYHLPLYLQTMICLCSQYMYFWRYQVFIKKINNCQNKYKCWISNVIHVYNVCHSLFFLFSMTWGDSYSFCWYWWNYWTSLIKLSVYKYN